jgi:alkanesulfonate monooxygenase SsuD/methylene tetrahydromethanopterin reductase-like flavin-dependent oxidoreductase (luciferase family)
MLTWIAASTSRIKVATRVLGVPYRPPVIVAKMAEALDRLSGGRLILGLGGGAGRRATSWQVAGAGHSGHLHLNARRARAGDPPCGHPNLR